MNQKRLAAVLVCLVLIIGSGTAVAEFANPYWERIGSGLPNQVVVLHNVYERHDELVNIEARVPQIWGLSDAVVQMEINQSINLDVEFFISDLVHWAELAQEEYEADPSWPSFLPYEGIVEYEVKYNKGGLLSIVMTFYQFTGGAHGMTFTQPINIDLTTGRELTFADLFSNDEERNLMAEYVDAKIKEEPTWFFIDEFDASMFHDDQQFYMTEGQIVTIFGLYDIAPYAAGIQEFALPIP